MLRLAEKGHCGSCKNFSYDGGFLGICEASKSYGECKICYINDKCENNKYKEGSPKRVC